MASPQNYITTQTTRNTSARVDICLTFQRIGIGGIFAGNCLFRDSSTLSFCTVFIFDLASHYGEIDTLNEKFQGQASIEARWLVELSYVSPVIPQNDQNQFNQGRAVTLLKYAETHWHPQLFIENGLGDLKEQIRYTAKKTSNGHVCICEHRDVKGLFWEKLELHHFPTDVQELDISIGTMLFDDSVILYADPNRCSGINREAFVDQQEWLLYQHVVSEQRFVHEDFQNAFDQENNTVSSSEQRKRSFLTISCRAARRSTYFYWNGYGLIFLITVCSFCIFSMPPYLPQNRLQTGATLLLTSITFRWTVNRSLPTISYLTSLDKYAFVSIFILIILCTWHAIIGAIIYIESKLSTTTYDDKNAWIDHIIFCSLFGLYIVMHLGLLIWLYIVPLGKRREMQRNDVEYRNKLRAVQNERHSPSRSHQIRHSEGGRVPTRQSWADGKH